MRSSVTIVAVLVLLLSVGCEKQEVPSAHVGELQPPRRPMEELQPAASLAPEAVPAAEPEPLVAAAPIEPAPQEPAASPALRMYTVMKNDTLWSISKRHLGSGKRWKEIVAINPGLDPAKLMPGQVITLPEE